MPTYSDIDINLERQTDGDIKVNTEIDAVKNSLHNIVKTLQGSRRMFPEFATNVQSLLFEPVDEFTAQQLGEILISSIQRWDSRVIIENLNIVSDEDRGLYECSLTFRITESSYSDKIDFILRQI